MMRQIIFTFALMFLVTGCGNNNSKTDPDPSKVVTETIRPSVETQEGVAWEVNRDLGRGWLKQENVTIKKTVPPQYVVTGPRKFVEKLKRLASGEWLFVVLQPKTEAARNAVKSHIHKFRIVGLQEEDAIDVVPNTSWIVIGPKEIVERLQKVANPE